MLKLKKIILPVFFDVSPDDVKLESPLYRDALHEHAHGTEKAEWEMALKHVLEVSGWKSNAQGEQALREVATVKGWELKDKGYGEFCKAILAEVMNNLKLRDRIVSDCLVGIDDQVEQVHRLLDLNADGVRYVLIHGIGGIGKTTLAKVVFNRFHSSFDHYSFLSDIRELSQRHGVKYLQKQLLTDICRISKDLSSCDEGIKTIHDMLPNKKILIVLDDADKREWIENLIPSSGSLGPGSRVIVTARDERVLAVGQEIVSTLKMDELPTRRALELFCMHAFGLNFPPLDYLDLSNEVVSLAGHLPLHLEVAGSYLRRKGIEVWNIYIRQLRKIPEKEVQEKLMISYNALDIRTKHIFLDIACFFVNKEKRDAIYMWEACDFHPEAGIEELISKSLVKVIDGNKFWMHDFVRDVGRDIARQEDLIDPGECSRLWIHEEALGGVLERKEGTRKVQALRLSADEPSKCFKRKNLKKMINLRFVEWSGLSLKGKFEHHLSRLRWLSWHNCPSKFHAKMLDLSNLVILDLSRSDISKDWRGWTQTNMGCNLKVLNLTDCVFLTKIPDLSKFKVLEILILQGCIKLNKIDVSICKATRLKHLNLIKCFSLQGLPEELCVLSDLEEILMSGAGFNHSFNLPKSIGNLSVLTVLEVREVRMNEPPDSICQLKRLKRLALSQCWGITKFPDSFGDLESLVTLDVFRCEDLRELPDSIGILKQLKVIDLQLTQISRLPRTIGMLEQLEELNADYAFRLAGEIPPEIDRLSKLRFLDFSFTAVQLLPSLSNLSHLQTLHLHRCDNLLEVPELPPSLTNLVVWSMSVQNVLSDFSTLTNLISLTWRCPKVGWPWRDQSCAHPHLSRLIHVDLHLTNNLFPGLSTMKNLSSLSLWSCGFGERFGCLGVCMDMKCLQILNLGHCDCEVLNKDCLPENVEQLVVRSCYFLALVDVSHMRKLKSLTIRDCQELKKIIGLGELECRRRSNIYGCPLLPHSMRSTSELLIQYHHHPT